MRAGLPPAPAGKRRRPADAQHDDRDVVAQPAVLDLERLALDRLGDRARVAGRAQLRSSSASRSGPSASSSGLASMTPSV